MPSRQALLLSSSPCSCTFCVCEGMTIHVAGVKTQTASVWPWLWEDIRLLIWLHAVCNKSSHSFCVSYIGHSADLSLSNTCSKKSIVGIDALTRYLWPFSNLRFLKSFYLKVLIFRGFLFKNLQFPEFKYILFGLPAIALINYIVFLIQN